jgi:transposase
MWVMSSEDLRKLQIISRVVEQKATRLDAQKLLDVSERTIRRYLRSYNTHGPLFLKHGNAGRAPINKKPEQLKVAIQKLIEERYPQFNMLHLQEKLLENEGLTIKRETLRKWCHEINCVKRRKKKRSRGHYYRQRLSQEGLMLQMDGSHHRWWPGEKSCLIAAIDDATSKIPYAEFFASEDTYNCMKVIQKIIEKFGIPHALYVDRAGIFKDSKRANFGQFVRACRELGIQVLYAYSPEAKGRVERLFQTLQDRLIAEMSLKNIKGYWSANYFLHQEFLPKHYHPRFTTPAENPEIAYKTPESSISLKEIFCFKEQRVVGRDHTISLGNKKYLVKNPTQHSLTNRIIEIREYHDKSWTPFYNGEPIKLEPLKKSLQGIELPVEIPHDKIAR